VPDEKLPLAPPSPAVGGPTAVREDAPRLRERAAFSTPGSVALHDTLASLEDRTRAAEAGAQRVRELLESITDGFYALDLEGRFTYVNASLERITGRSREELLGNVAWDMFGLAPDSLPRRKYEEARRTGKGQVYEAYIERIGRWLEFRSFPGPASHTVFIRDVTEQRRQDEALRRSEERWRLAGQATSDLMYDWDIATGALFFSDSLRTRFGHEHVEPRIEWWEAQIHPDDLQAVVADLQRALDRGEASWTSEYRFRRGDGTWVTIVDRGAFMRDDTGRAVRMVGAMQDVTEQRRAEQRLLQSQKMEVMGQLAAGVAHDFNNVLTAMFGYLELAEANLREGKATLGEIAEVRRGAEQAAALTRQLLVFSRRQIDQPRSIDLAALVAESGGLLARLVGRKHRLDVRSAPTLWSVRIDPTHAEQVLMNLVANARDAMPEAGVVSVALDNVTLDAPITSAMPAPVAPGAWVRLVVRDTGVGMDAATAARMWEPFFTTKGVGRGTGLGLPTVRGLVARAGGALVVESEPGRGTTFAVYLPRAGTPAAAPATERLAADGTERVLLVEDDPAVRDALHRSLERHGYAVVAPATVDAAVARLRGPIAVDVVVLDAELGARRTGGGEAVLDALAERRRRGVPAPALVHVVGVVPDGARPPGAEPRSVILEKPFATDALLRAMRRVLDGA
jgi:PAS domain S-box-containing protein